MRGRERRRRYDMRGKNNIILKYIDTITMYIYMVAIANL